ncbi:hypothetical protein [Marinobacter similis]|uniref:hypothetical protein n=1 Tax=Marinobacter similis TaxID=1420916 RepID=UPI000A5CDF0C|nr:hypothetical protein [Marinobacter similis]
MNFDLTEEQQMLNDSLRRFVTNELGFERRAEVIASSKGTDPATWLHWPKWGCSGLAFPRTTTASVATPWTPWW